MRGPFTGRCVLYGDFRICSPAGRVGGYDRYEHR